ncbi:2789_t:CDS:1 [Diversispora eburnea]|uniref:2789_t:CDS:1 n=1 Tax=Diversispora eburnea TaxID=1213867 RepID=A0A9N8VZJ6_9GLOM|nr:2789_t:CDS:1 [Diversispora eburnea]
MSLPTNYQNISIPFPPNIDVGVIVEEHLKKGIRNANQTGNAFMIYLRIFRKAYSNVIAMFNLPSRDVSRFASSSWIQEPPLVKNFYRQKAKEVKKCFKKNIPLYFINKFGKSNQVSTNGSFKSLEKKLSNHKLENTDSNSPNALYTSPQHLNVDQNSPNIAYSNYQGSAYPSPQLDSPNTIYPSPLYQVSVENTDSNPPNTIYRPLYHDTPNTIYPGPQDLNIDQDSLYITYSNYQDYYHNLQENIDSNSICPGPQDLNIDQDSFYPNTQNGNIGSNSPNTIYPDPQHLNIDQDSLYISYYDYHDTAYSDPHHDPTSSNNIYSGPQHLNIDQNSLYITYSNYQDYAYNNPQLENTNSNPNTIYSSSLYQDSAYPNLQTLLTLFTRPLKLED